MKKKAKKKLMGLGKSFLKYAERANKNLDLPRVDSPTKKKVSKPKAKQPGSVKKPMVKKPRSVKQPKSVKSPGQQGQVIVNVNVGSSGGTVSNSSSGSSRKKSVSKSKKKRRKKSKKKKSSSTKGFDDVLYGYEY